MNTTFDVETFLRSLRATKPPWECPKCKKIYKSYCGMEYHLQNFDHTTPNTPNNKPSYARKSKLKFSKRKKHYRFERRSPSPLGFLSQTRETLTWAEAQRMVEVESEGKVYRLNIDEKLDIISDSDIEKDDDISVMDTSKNTIENANCKLPANSSVASTKEKSANNSSAFTNQLNKGNNFRINSSFSKLPKPSYRLLKEYEKESLDAPIRPEDYYCYVEASPEELENEIEYDMDEEDTVWLELMNKQRLKEGLNQVTNDQLELLMDRFEKESYFEQAKNGLSSHGSQALIDEDAVCCVCNDGECQNSNVILFCDMCDLAVHQECYGVPYIPEGQWLCRRCLQSPSCPVDCVLCPSKSGAFKQTDDGRWAHVVCALWVPEVGFGNHVFLEPIDGLKNVPPARWKLTCYICKQKNSGACIQCHRTNCYVAFHVTCAQQAGLHMKLDTQKKSGRNGVTVSVIKEAFCDAHSPANASIPQKRFNGQQTTVKVKQTSDKMKRARKMLAEKRNQAPQISLPYVPRDKVSTISRRITLQKKNAFIQRLLSYWTLKRQSRNGVPLLRRLQSQVHQNKSKDPEKNSKQYQQIEQLKYWHRLRHDLERARLLIELIRKREKLKREIVRIAQAASELRLTPLLIVLKRLLSKLQAIDVAKVFAEPVLANEAPDYHTIIEKPMDFSTMAAKISNHQYRNFCEFEDDFNLVINNCLEYNNHDTIFYRLAVKMREHGGAHVRNFKNQVEEAGYDLDTGTLLTESHKKELLSEQESRSNLSLNEKLQNSFVQLDDGLLSGEKTAQLKAEINLIKRKIFQDSNPTMTRRRNSARRFSADDAGSSSISTENEAVHSDVDSNFKISSKLRPVNLNKTRTLRKRLCSAKPSLESSSEPRSKKSLLSRAESCPIGEDTDDIDSDQDAGSIGKTVKKENISSTFSSSTLLTSPPAKSELSCRSKLCQPHGSSVSRRTAFFKKKQRRKLSTAVEEKTVTSTNDEQNINFISPTNATHTNNDSFADSESSDKETLSLRNRVLPSLDSYTNGLGTSRDEPVFVEDPSDKSREECSSGHDEISRRNSFFNSVPEQRDASPKKVRSFSCSLAHHSSSSSEERSSFFVEDGAELPFEYHRRQSCVSATEDEYDEDEFPHIAPLDLVWAKCRGYPPYPALLIDPKMPRSGFCHNGVPIPVPPLDVLQVGDKRIENGNHRIYLVLFFDTKRTWQWLPRNKLELLGDDYKSDCAKLAEGRRPAIRRNVEAAFKRALVHRGKVRGEIPDSDDERYGAEFVLTNSGS